MRLNITPAVRQFFKKLASEGGKARAKKYDHQTLSQWAKLGGRPKNSAETRNPRKKRKNGGRRTSAAKRGQQ